MYHFSECLNHLYKVGIFPIFFWMGKLRCREIKQQADSHMAFKYTSQNLNLSDTKAHVCAFQHIKLLF